jgi:hypothetical protein
MNYLNGIRDANHYPTARCFILGFRHPSGRPRGRSDCAKPNALAVRRIHDSLPIGRLRAIDSVINLASAGSAGKFTVASHRGGSGSGHDDNNGNNSCPRFCRTWQLPHRHRSARLTSFARSGLRSTYRSTVNRCSSCHHAAAAAGIVGGRKDRRRASALLRFVEHVGASVGRWVERFLVDSQFVPGLRGGGENFPWDFISS